MDAEICDSLLNEIKTKIKMPSKFFEETFAKFSFLFLTRKNKIEEEINKISGQLKIIIVNKIIYDDKREPKKNYYMICFNYTLIIICQDDFLMLQDFFITERDSKIFYMQKEIQNEINQLVLNKDPKISLKFCQQKEFEHLLDESNDFISYKLNISKLSPISKVFTKTIIAFLIRKSYFESRKLNIDHFNSTIQKKDNIDNYVKIRKLHSDQSSGVSLVMNIENGQLFALKENLTNDDTLKLFLREKESYLKINHPFLLRFYHSIVQENSLYLILEFIDGKTLKNFNDFEFDEKFKLKIIFSILIVIQYLHFKNYIYRDLKPNNLMIDSDNSIVLIDLDQMIENSIEKTGPNSTHDFSLDFAAPELRECKNVKISEKVDIYSIGVIINYIMNNHNILNFKGFPSKFSKLKNICIECIDENPENRPSISKVISDFISQIYLNNFTIEEELFKMLEQNLTCSENIEDPDAFYIVGLIYSKFNDDDEINIQKAVEYLTVAADKNHADALFCLGEINKDEKEKINFYSRSAELGNNDAQYKMGIHYIDEQNYDLQKALEYLQKSAEQNNSNAQQLLGQIYVYGYENIPKDVSKGIDYLNKSVKQKNKFALYFLGVIYYEGELVNRNVNQALEYLNASSDQNFYDAQYFLGSIYYEGKFIIRNTDKAIHFATLASNHKKAEAQRLLGQIYINQIPDVSVKFVDDKIKIKIGFTTEINLEEIDKPLHYFSLAAIQNDIKSISVLAYIYSNIKIDSRYNKKSKYYESLQNYYQLHHDFFFNPILIEYDQQLNANNINEVIDILSDLSDQNDLQAKFALGIIYFDEVYVERDMKKAIHYLKEAADQNFVKALIELSRIYVFGRFVDKNVNLGIEYLFKAAKQNDLDSQISLLNYFSNGKYCEPNSEKVNEVLDLVENQKNLKSLIKFASICYEGKIIEKDDYRVIKLLQKAENLNCIEASVQLGILFFEKNDLNQAEKHFIIAAQKNDSYGLFYMGLIKFKIGKYHEAFDYFLKSAENENYYSLIYVALFLLDGKYVTKNVNKAFQFLEVSSRKYPQAFYILGSIYFDGNNDNSDKIRRGRTYLLNSASFNYVRAYLKIGILFIEDKYFDFCVNSAIHYLTNYITKFPHGNQTTITVSNFRGKYVFYDVIKEIIKKKLSEISDQHYEILFSGRKYNNTNIINALNYFLYESIYKNNSDAQFVIGSLFYEGKYVKKDIQTSIKFLNYSANQLNFNSKIFLGVIYSNGEFIQKDIEKSIEFFSSVNSPLYSESQFICGSFYYEGIFVERNIDKAKFYFRNASTFYNCYAKNNLGIIFRNGIETNKNITQAIEYFKEAIKLGNDEVAAYNLAHLYYYEKQFKIDNFDELYKLLIPSVNKNLISAFELLCLIVFKEFGFSLGKNLENKFRKFDKHSCDSLAQRVFTYINFEMKDSEMYEKLLEKIRCVQLIYTYYNGKIFPTVESDKIRKKVSSKLYHQKPKKQDINDDFYDGFSEK